MLCPCARHIYPQKVLVIPKKLWLSPNMTEKLFTGTLSIKQTKPRSVKKICKPGGITLSFKTAGDTQGFQCISRDLINNYNRGIKHDFPFINIRKVPREVLKTEGEAQGFHTSRNQTPNQTFLKPNQTKPRSIKKI